MTNDRPGEDAAADAAATYSTHQLLHQSTFIRLYTVLIRVMMSSSSSYFHNFLIYQKNRAGTSLALKAFWA
jgi:hypothetical protein